MIKSVRQNFSAGFAPLILIIAVVVICGLAAAGYYFFKGKNVGLGTQNKLSENIKVAVVKPVPDMGRARQLTVEPNKHTYMQVTSREEVLITLDIPEGAVKEKTLVKLIPYYYDKNAKSPTAGVMVSPGNLSFAKPVTLSFELSKSQFKNNAPENAIDLKHLRKTGTAQVMLLNDEATTYTPMLVGRGLETKTYLPAQILSGGGYVFSLDGQNQVANAKNSLNGRGTALSDIEAATTILFNNEKLSTDEEHKAKSATAKILAKKEPPSFELYAATILQKKIQDNKFSWIPEALAYESAEGFFQAACRQDGYTVEQYLGYAMSAQLQGYDNIGESCINKAKNKVAEDTKKLLASGDVDVKTLMVALKDVQLLGVDDDTNLDERLIEKAKEVAVKDAKKVADNPEATPIDSAVALQKLQALGVEEGPTYDKLEEIVKKATEKYDEPKDDPFDVEATIDEEEVLYNAGMASLGIEMLKLFGFEEFDQASVQKRFDEMAAQTKEMNEAVYAACLEMGGDDCEGTHTKLNGMIREAEQESYKASSELGRMQSQEYETPEYKAENGEYSLYFEPSPDPSDQDYSLDDQSNYDDQTEPASDEPFESWSNEESENSAPDEDANASQDSDISE